MVSKKQIKQIFKPKEKMCPSNEANRFGETHGIGKEIWQWKVD